VQKREAKAELTEASKREGKRAHCGHERADRGCATEGRGQDTVEEAMGRREGMERTITYLRVCPTMTECVPDCVG